MSFNQVRDLNAKAFENMDFSEHGAHARHVQGVQDLSEYLASFLIGTIVPILPGRARDFYPNGDQQYHDKFDTLAEFLAKMEKSGHPILIRRQPTLRARFERSWTRTAILSQTDLMPQGSTSTLH